MLDSIAKTQESEIIDDNTLHINLFGNNKIAKSIEFTPYNTSFDEKTEKIKQSENI